VKYTDLGSTGLAVSRVCLGTWSYGGDWGDADLEIGKEVVRTARDQGVNFFDTARAYGPGRG
jgi:aryl-alcohol dehydrogenase-like predicted oxidoreductase